MEKRSHRSRYSLNTLYSFGDDESAPAALVEQSGRAPPEDMEARQFETLLANWHLLGERKRKKILDSDLPSRMVGELWLKLSGADALLAKNTGVYDMLLAKRCCPEDEARIVKDVDRTFTDVSFYSSDVQTLLFSVLKAYCVFDPSLGYCQGLNFIAANLLTNLSPEKSFWVLVTLIKGSYNLRRYFERNVPELVVNLYCVDRLIEMYLPALFSHFKEERVSPVMFASEWFTTLFTFTFPISFTRRVWTEFFVHGKLYIFRVSMAILKLLEKKLLKLPFESIVQMLKAPPVTLNKVLEKAERFSSIDESMYKHLSDEAEAHAKMENLLC